MKIDVLMSTMVQKDYSLIKKSKMKNGVIVNQTNKSCKSILNESILWIDSKTKGLSKSRNICLDNSNSEICLLADDDLEYVSNYEEIVSDAFEKSDADILCFCVEGIEKKFKNYSNKKSRIGYLKSLKISSVEIAFKRASIIDNNVRFDEDFGSGALFPMGEENIFLYDALKKNLKIEFIPIKIADLHIESSSWFKGFDGHYLHNRGAIFYRMSKWFYPFLIFQFSIRKKSLFDNFNLIEIMKGQFEGVKIYKNRKKRSN